MKHVLPLLSLAAFLMLAGCYPPVDEEPPLPEGESAALPPILPVPKEVDLEEEGALPLPRALRCHVASEALQPLVAVMDYEYRMRTGGQVTEGTEDAPCRLRIDPALAEETYRLAVGEHVTITGGSYRAVAMGSVTFMQLLRTEEEGASAPKGRIEDHPDKPYRGLLVDVARERHDLATLKQLILLSRWYKIRYLQLHLTDDQAFTFPVEAFPELPTPGHHFTKEELRELDAFARRHGVVLVPELEVPGHAGQLTEKLPEIFAIQDREENPGTINMGREAAYEALDRIVGEMADVFETTPYIHIGGDEASLEHLEDDPDVQRYLEAHDLPNASELYRHFLVRMNEIVESHGKQTVVWEGFREEGDVEIPRDILVMAWETLYQLPQDLLADGYTVINATWKPLYVVNRKKWPPAYIYNWNLYRWENWLRRAPSYEPIQLEPTAQVIGASMSSWAQPPHIELPTLRRRLPAMSERTWNATLEPEHPAEAFLQMLERTDAALQDVLSPVTIQAEGLRYPNLDDGHENEQYWFGDTLTLTLETDSNQAIYYTLDGTTPTPQARRYTAPITLRESTSFKARAFTPEGAPVGYARWRAYKLRPIEAEVTGGLETPLAELWETLRSWEAAFSGTLTIELEALREGTIRYTLDGSAPTPRVPAYDGPITLSESATVTAQLFDAARAPVGEPWQQQFVRSE